MIEKLIERHRDALILLARILLTALFVISGFAKLTDFKGTVSYMEYVHAPMPEVAATIAIAMEFLVGLALLLGVCVRWLALAMIVFVAGAAIIGHPFWALEASERAMAQTQFLKNLSIIGGLLLLAITGSGRFSLTKS